jgi:GTP-binding protein
MPKLPLVAIIGRPNTGKSTLFNRLVRARVAIESPVAGTTRDHVTRKVRTEQLDYLLIDTGGMGGGTEDKDFEDDVEAQSLLALEAADIIILTLDSRTQLLKSDEQIIRILRRKRKRHVPVIVVVTKCDTQGLIEEARGSFHAMGLGEDLIFTGAAHNVGTEILEERIITRLKEMHFVKEEAIVHAEGTPRVAIIGKPNVGKSSLINALMSETQRKTSPKLVSSIPGTTRDSTDTIVTHEDREYLFVDTAGLRRPARVDADLEGLSTIRTVQAIEQCDVALLLVDGDERVSQQDKRIASLVIERGKGLIILVNKIDLRKSEERIEKVQETKGAFPFCRYAPVVPVSTITRENLVKIFPLVDRVRQNLSRRIPPKELHRFVDDALHGQPMGELKSCKHVTQAKDAVPTFVLFVRHPKKVQISQLRYLENRLRSTFDFDGVPIRLITK